jgi:hypothetical protein
VTSAVSSVVPATGTWTYLTGVYDAAAHTATLYVNGQAQQTVTATATGGTGPLVLGGVKSAGARANLFNGAIDEAATFEAALSAANAGTLYSQNGVPTGLSATREYTLDGTTTDATGTDGTFALSGGAAFGPGYTDSAGQSATESGIGHSTGQGMTDPGVGYAQTSSPVVDTSQSFTVSAWVKLTDKAFYDIAGQEGVHTSALRLSVSPDHWGMGMPAADGDGDAAGWRWASSPTAPEVGVWTHLTGVYDGVAGKERLYVNGTLSAETTIPAGTAWRATGAFTLGRYHVDSASAGAFKGTIDQVQVWDRPLQAAEIAGLANSAVLRASYQLDGTLTDSVSGASGTPSGGAAMTTDDNGANVARFPKYQAPGAQVEGPRPQNLRTDRSFTLEAWAKHTWTAADAAAQQQVNPANTGGVDEPGRAVLGVNSPQFSPYLFGYRGAKDASGVWHPRWSFVMAAPTATVTAPDGWAVLPDADAESNVWTHLTGTYDAVTHTACMYATTDAYQDPPKCVTNVNGFNGASDLEDLFLGRGKWGGLDSDYWYGDLRGVRIYSGVLDAQHINADAVLDHP